VGRKEEMEEEEGRKMKGNRGRDEEKG